MKRILAVAAALLVACSTVLVASPAQALTPPSTRSAPPAGGGYTWGVPVAQLERTTPDNCSKITDRGGWSKRMFYSAGTRFGSSGDVVVPATFYVAEPCYVSTNAPGIGRFTLGIARMTMSFLTPPAPRAPAIEGGSFSGNPYGTTTTDYYLMCQSSEWATTATRINANTNGSIEHAQALPTGGVEDKTGTSSANFGHQVWGNSAVGSCPYLRSAGVKLCVWAGAGGTGMACTAIVWTAEKWFANQKYTPKQGEYGNPFIDQCRVLPTHPDCIYIDPPAGSIDGTDYAAVCAGMPSFVAPGWANFSDWVPALVAWWNMAIGHYGRCLFVPWNGWDRNGAVTAAWEAGPATEIVAPMSDAAAAFNIAGGCGVIVPETTIIPGFSVNTCTWYWAAPAKTALAWGVMLGGGVGLIWLVIQTIIGVISKRSNNPIGGD